MTAGFTKLQQSKIDCLGVLSDFKEIVVVDQETTQETKRDVFVRQMEKNGFQIDELIAIATTLNRRSEWPVIWAL